MEIKKLGPENWAQWKTFRLGALKDTPEAFGASYDEEINNSEQKWREFLRKNDVLGAFDDAKLVATAGFSQLIMTKMKHRGILFSVYTTPNHRKKGLSRSLTKKVIEHATSIVEQLHLNCVTIYLAALAFYESLGFETYGTEPNALYVNGIYYDQYLMVKRLKKVSHLASRHYVEESAS